MMRVEKEMMSKVIGLENVQGLAVYLGKHGGQLKVRLEPVVAILDKRLQCQRMNSLTMDVYVGLEVLW
jgi:hypothetical protein